MNIGYLPDPILTNYVQGYVFKMQTRDCAYLQTI